MAADFHILVHDSVQSDFVEKLPFDELKSRITVFSSRPPEVFTDPVVPWGKNNSYLMLVAPSEWLEEEIDFPDVIKSRVFDGSARIIFWNAEPVEHISLPATFFPPTLPAVGLSFLMNHLCRFPGPGLQMVLPVGAKILTERIATEKQLGRKIEQCMEFINSMAPSFANRTMPLRSALTLAANAALSQPLAGAKANPPTFQVGVSQETVALSIRWIASSSDFKPWQTPELAWSVSFERAVASLITINPESREIELRAIFTAQEIARTHIAAPYGIDIMSATRVTTAASLPNQTADFNFDYFAVEDDLKEKMKFAKQEASEGKEQKEKAPAVVAQSGPDAANSNLSIELNGVKVEKQKIEKQLKATQEQLSEMTRKMSQAVDAEKAAQVQIKSLTSQLENVKSAMAASSAQEINALKVRLENAKSKETELVKKLSQAVEQISKLKSGSSQATGT